MQLEATTITINVPPVQYSEGHCAIAPRAVRLVRWERVVISENMATLRTLPGVENMLRSKAASRWLRLMPRQQVVNLIRQALDEVRTQILEKKDLKDLTAGQAIEVRVDNLVKQLRNPSLQPVINSSGVILHTNLGRAPLGVSALQALQQTAAGYSNLEYDIEKGKRGKRDDHVGTLLQHLLGTPALVVNNNAAAIFIVMDTLARNGQVIVSRGELIEIGDGFRIPEILEVSRAVLREVGTTNRTRIEDYRCAVCKDTKALLRIHPSNFHIEGFTGRPKLPEMVNLANSTSIPLVEDLGSGSLIHLGQVGIKDEPTVMASLQAGVDVVTFSGDKLLGGPQAGIIAGKSAIIARIRRNPLFRVLRVDKLTIAALGATLQDYLFGREDAVPVLHMMKITERSLAIRARKFIKRLGLPDVQVVAGESLLGGGSTPAHSLPTRLIVLAPRGKLTIKQVEKRLRSHTPAVIARIEKDCLLLDLRTVLEDQEEELIKALQAACS